MSELFGQNFSLRFCSKWFIFRMGQSADICFSHKVFQLWSIWKICVPVNLLVRMLSKLLWKSDMWAIHNEPPGVAWLGEPTHTHKQKGTHAQHLVTTLCGLPYEMRTRPWLGESATEWERDKNKDEDEVGNKMGKAKGENVEWRRAEPREKIERRSREWEGCSGSAADQPTGSQGAKEL